MTRGRRVTLHDVASAAGVSATTASYILNGRSRQMRISVATERRVLECAESLGYRPHHHAQGLRTSATRTIGVITDFVVSGHYASRMLSGASAEAHARGHLLLWAETSGDLDLERSLVGEMVDRGVDGLVYASMVTATVMAPSALAAHRAVLLNCVSPGLPLPSILPDEKWSGRAAADAVLATGRTAGIHIVGEQPTPNSLAGRERRVGIVDRLRAARVGLRDDIACPWDARSAYHAVDAALARGLRPQALICLNDRIAVGAYAALRSRGLDVPTDVVMISFDATEMTNWLGPPLTSIGIPYEEMGRRAVERLLEPEVLSTPVTYVRGEMSSGETEAVLAAPGAGVSLPRSC